MRAPEIPTYALVLWPDTEDCLPDRITLDALPAARLRKALVIAREDEILSEPLPSSMDMTLLSNPRRYVDTGED